MIRRAIVFAGICVALIAAYRVGTKMYTKQFSPEATALYTGEKAKIEVHYSQPSKKARPIFGETGLAPFGEVWRTGANEATEITLTSNVSISGHKLNAGTYTLFTIPDEEQWTIIFNEELDQWGSFQYDEIQDVLRVGVDAFQVNRMVEKFTIGFEEEQNEVIMLLEWDRTLVKIPFKIEQS